MAKNNNDWKDRLNVVYSTNPDFSYDTGETEEPETQAPEKQPLKIQLDKRNRNGKSVTLITGFSGKEEDLKELGKTLLPSGFHRMQVLSMPCCLSHHQYLMLYSLLLNQFQVCRKYEVRCLFRYL